MAHYRQVQIGEHVFDLDVMWQLGGPPFVALIAPDAEALPYETRAKIRETLETVRDTVFSPEDNARLAHPVLAMFVDQALIADLDRLFDKQF